MCCTTGFTPVRLSGNHPPEYVCIVHLSAHGFALWANPTNIFCVCKTDGQWERQREMHAHFQLWGISSYKLLRFCQLQSCSFDIPDQTLTASPARAPRAVKEDVSVSVTLSKENHRIYIFGLRKNKLFFVFRLFLLICGEAMKKTKCSWANPCSVKLMLWSAHVI